MAIIPTGISSHRPFFSATTQSSISATIPEVVYTPPTPVATASSRLQAKSATDPAQILDISQVKLFVKPGDATSSDRAILAARKIPTTSATAAEVKQSIDRWSEEIDRLAQSYAKQQHW